MAVWMGGDYGDGTTVYRFDAPLYCGRCYECGSLLLRTIVEGNYMNDDRAYAAMTFLPGLGFFVVSQKSCSRGFNNVLLLLIGSWLQLRKSLLWCVVAVAGALEFTVKHGELLFVCWGKMATLVWRAKFFLDSATTVGHSLRAACDECYGEYRKRTDNHHLMNVVNVVYGSSVTFEPYVNTRNERVIYQDLYMQGFRPGHCETELFVEEGLCGR